MAWMTIEREGAEVELEVVPGRWVRSVRATLWQPAEGGHADGYRLLVDGEESMPWPIECLDDEEAEEAGRLADMAAEEAHETVLELAAEHRAERRVEAGR